MSIACFWAFFIPIFQGPDEDIHADYVFSLYTHGRLIQGKEAPLALMSHPICLYLTQAVYGEKIKHRYFVKVPTDYGTKQFFSKLDREVPKMQPHTKGYTNPIMVLIYPVGYYALTAIWLGLMSNFSHSITFLFFSARILSVLLLGIGLTLTYLTMKELGLQCWQRYLVLAVIAFFPLTSFIASYMQPDNLSLIAVSACFIFALRWQKTRESKFIWALSISLSCLLLTKYQFFGCTSIAILTMIVTREIYLKTSLGKTIVTMAILLFPSMLAAILQYWISGECSLPRIDVKHWHWFPVDTESHFALKHGGQALSNQIWNALADEAQTTYTLNGQTFNSFWGNFGWLDTPLVIISPDFDHLLRSILILATWIIIALTLASLGKRIFLFSHFVRQGKWRRAIYFACANPVMNSYFVFVLLLFSFNIIVYPSFSGQGRHWYPLMLPIVLCAAGYAPSIFPSRKARKIFFVSITSAWILYSLVGSYYAIGCIKNRYYAHESAPINLQQLRTSPIGASCSVEALYYMNVYPTFDRAPFHGPYYLASPAGKEIGVEGWAIDFPNESLASNVLLFIDHNKMYQANYGLENNAAVKQMADEKYRFSGFGLLIPTTDLKPGKHTISIKVVGKDNTTLYSATKEINILIE